MTRARTLLGFAAPLLVMACTGSETGNGARDDKPVEVEMMLVPGSDGALVARDRSGAELEIVTAVAVVDRIDLMLPEGASCPARAAAQVAPYEAFCAGESGRVRVEGPWVFDLVTGESSPSLEALALPLGPLERVEVRLAPGPRDAWTVAADGLFGAHDFRIELRLGDVVRFDARGLELDDATTRLVLELDPALWFADLELAACVASGDVPSDDDGVLLLHEGKPQACGPVAAKVSAAIRAATRAHLD